MEVVVWIPALIIGITTVGFKVTVVHSFIAILTSFMLWGVSFMTTLVVGTRMTTAVRRRTVLIGDDRLEKLSEVK